MRVSHVLRERGDARMLRHVERVEAHVHVAAVAHQRLGLSQRGIRGERLQRGLPSAAISCRQVDEQRTGGER